MKYRNLNSIQRANYWAMMGLVDIFYDLIDKDPTRIPDFMRSMNILETNLKIELFTDGTHGMTHGTANNLPDHENIISRPFPDHKKRRIWCNLRSYDFSFLYKSKVSTKKDIM